MKVRLISLGAIVAFVVALNGIPAVMAWINTPPRDRTWEEPLALGSEQRIPVPKHTSSLTIPFTVEVPDMYRVDVESHRGGVADFEIRDETGGVALDGSETPEIFVRLTGAVGGGKVMNAGWLDPGEYTLVLTGGTAGYEGSADITITSPEAENIDLGHPLPQDFEDGLWALTVQIPEDAPELILHYEGYGVMMDSTSLNVTDAEGNEFSVAINLDANSSSIEEPPPWQMVILLVSTTHDTEDEFLVAVRD